MSTTAQVMGIAFWKFNDAGGGLIDIRFSFTVDDGKFIGLYGFDAIVGSTKKKKGKKSQDQTYDDRVQEIFDGLPTTDTITTVGTAGGPLTKPLPGHANELCDPTGERTGHISAGPHPSTSSGFWVRLVIDPEKRSGSNFVMNVPFMGALGKLKVNQRPGRVFLVTDGRKAVTAAVKKIAARGASGGNYDEE